MTITRQPGTVKFAAYEIVSSLGHERVKNLLGLRSTQSVYNLTNDQGRLHLSMERALLMSEEYCREFNKHSPLFHLFEQKELGVLSGDEGNIAECIKSSILYSTSTLGDMAKKIADYSSDSSDEGENLSNNEIDNILVAFHEHFVELMRFERRLVDQKKKRQEGSTG